MSDTGAGDEDRNARPEGARRGDPSAGPLPGAVYLVGAGPGAPDLLTLRAARLLAAADVVLYDALVDPEVVALAQRARKIPVGKRGGRVSTEQRFINRLLVAAARSHRLVVRLKGGDPLLFGRAHEEIDALAAAGIEHHVVPGITAAAAAAASARIPHTRRGVARTVLLATPAIGPGQGPSTWADAAAAGDTVWLYMGGGDAGRVRDALLARGMAADTPVFVGSGVSLPGERLRFGTLERLPETIGQRSGQPTLIGIGQVFAEGVFAEGSTRADAGAPLDAGARVDSGSPAGAGAPGHPARPAAATREPGGGRTQELRALPPARSA
jgi:uroporphyrin-III C-methyltransferase